MFCPILDCVHHFSIIHNSLSCSVHLRTGVAMRHWQIFLIFPARRYKEPVAGNAIHQAVRFECTFIYLFSVCLLWSMTRCHNADRKPAPWELRLKTCGIETIKTKSNWMIVNYGGEREQGSKSQETWMGQEILACIIAIKDKLPCPNYV